MADGQQMGLMRTGSGDGFHALFNSSGCFLKGFAHESKMSPYQQNPAKIWAGIYDAVPSEFSTFLKEPAFSINDVTFCIWRTLEDELWRCGVREFAAGRDPDGSEELLKLLDGEPKSYQKWASEYYERKIPLEAIKHVYQHKPLTAAVITLLNPESTLESLASDIVESGYSQELHSTTVIRRSSNKDS